MGPTLDMALLDQPQDMQDHLLVKCRPAPTASANGRSDSIPGWQQLLMKVPMGYPQQAPTLVFAASPGFTESCQVILSPPHCFCRVVPWRLYRMVDHPSKAQGLV